MTSPIPQTISASDPASTSMFIHPAASAVADLREAADEWRKADAGYDDGVDTYEAASDLSDTVGIIADSLSAKQDSPARMVPVCAFDGRDDATGYVEHLVGDRRVLEFVCDEHLRYIREEWTAEKDPAVAKLNLAGMITLPAYQVMPGMQTWIEASSLWQEVAWKFVVVSTEIRRNRDGQLRVRWTYADANTREFGFFEPVVGYFQRPEPRAIQDQPDGSAMGLTA